MKQRYSAFYIILRTTIRARSVALALSTLFACLGLRSVAQPFPIFNGSSSTCVGAFLDSGGQGASGYSDNEDFTYTICPDTPGGAISLNFLTFNLALGGAAPIDFMAIYDGNTTGAPLLGSWTGTGLQGQVVSASASNSSGCLTVVFHSNNNGVGVFAASITCYQPCVRPTAVATMGANPQRICPGEAVTFNSTASFAAAGFAIASRRWDFGDGAILNNAPAIVNHSYANPGAYTAQLYLLDNNGCASTNLVDLVVEVGTRPSFQGTGGTLTGCAGETVCLNGVVTGTTWNENPNPNLGGGVFLPDDVGSCFESNITYTQFPPGATLTNINGLLSICMQMEHSFIGDLVISIISPTGETVIMHQQGGGATFLGVPVDNDLTPNAQGTCWNYCFSPGATNGTWVDNAGATLPSGTYESLNPLSGLLGSQLNGTWTIQVCDLWASDNGFICDWSIDFDPSLFDDLITFTPIYGAACDSTYWTGPNITSTNGNCEQICVTPPAPGNYNYVYHATDNFGCTYDTTLTVSIIPGPQVTAGPDASTCNTPVQLNASVVSGGYPTNCNYTLSLFDEFGDGWTGLFGIGSNGSSVTITVNGVPTSYWLPNGTQGNVSIPVTSGSTISLSYTVGNLYNDEQSFALFNGSGGVVYASPLDPNGGLAWSGVANCPGGNFVYSWSPAAGLNNPNIPNPIATVAGTTQYCVTVYQQGHPSCTSTDCMTITVDQTVSAGTNGAIALCSNSPAVNLFAQLGGTPTAGGTWAAPGGAPHSGNFVPGVDPTGLYTYTVGGAGACGTPVNSTVNVTVYPLPSAGINSSVAFCNTDAAQALFPLLGASAMSGGSWTAPGGGAFAGTFNPSANAPGVYTYTVAGTAPCPSASATVTVSVSTPSDAGADNSITLCETSAPVVMVTQLGGTPDGTGSWTAPGGGPSSGGFDPATDPAGVYTYTVAGTPPCPNDVATLTIAVNPPPNAGNDGSITLCSSDAAVSLFAQLGGAPQAGGAWSGPSAVVGGMINPATMSAGVYTYTVTGTAPCPNETATVTVTINTPPDPGTPGVITLCSTDAPASLFAQLGGTPDAGGAWSGPSAVVGGMINPATMSAGVYTYTVTGTAPCPNEQATVTVTINTPPDPGTPGAITLCSTDAPASLFAQLGGTPDAGGAWSGPSPVAGGMINPATMSAGVYTYTVTGTAPCPNETATVTVTINTPPDPGTPGAITLCSTDAPASLFAQLGGTPDAGGAWSGPSPVVGGMIDPATMSAGVYTYTVTGTASCPPLNATVTVTINSMPDAGIDGGLTLCSSSPATQLSTGLNGTPDPGGVWTAPGGGASNGTFTPGVSPTGPYTYTVNGITPCPAVSAQVDVNVVTNPDAGTPGNATLCATDAAILLFSELGGTPDAGGTWSGPSAVVGGQYDPATMNPGVYTYTIAVPPPCVNASSTVTIAEVAPPNAGTDGAITLCISSPSTSLFAALGGGPQAGGVWSGPSPVVGGMFNPANMTAGAYAYTVNGTAPCPNDQSTVTVTVVSAPDAGTPGSATLCASDAGIDLFAELGGSPDLGGAWSGPSAVVAGQYDPATMNPGVYTYTITVPPPCVNASSTVTITEIAPPNAGTDGAITLCVSSPAASLFAALGGAQAGGSWNGPSPVAGGMFNPATMSAGVYTYTVNGTTPCPNDQSTVTVTVVSAPDAGTPGSATLCATDAAIDLFAELGGSPDLGGAWSGPSAVVAGQYDPATMNPGVYTYTITVPPPCVNASSTVTITEIAPPNAGTDGAITLCVSSPAASLFAALGGAQAGGNWSGPSPVTAGMFNPATMTAGVYTYTLNGTAPCPNDESTVTVTVVSAPNAGLPGNATLCTTDAALDLFSELNGTPDPGGAWSGPSPVVGGQYDPATMTAGVYTYTIVVPPPCVNASATVTIAEVAPPNAGTDGSITLCISSPTTSLFAALGPAAQAGGNWSGPSPVVGGTFNPATMNAGVYTYTVNGTSPCPNDDATVTVTVVSEPDPGTDGAVTLCASDALIALFGELGGTPDAGGTWSGPSAVLGDVFDPATMTAGVYTYTINVPPPCASVSSTVTVNVVQPPNAGSDGVLTLCVTSPAMALFTSLGGAPQVGGSWSGPSAIASGQFDPSSMNAGVYTYTVNGVAPCPNGAASVTVTVVSEPDPGGPGFITLCASDGPADLFSSIEGSPDQGGSWTTPGGSTFNGQFDPATMSAGVYTYTITVPPPCSSVSTTVTVDVIQPPNAGVDGAITLCFSNAPTPLFSILGGTPDAGGTWTTSAGTAFSGTFDPAVDAPGVFTYTAQGLAPCPADIATVTVAVTQLPNPGTDDILNLCIVGDPVALFPLLGTADPGGSWSGPGGAASTGTFTPGTSTPGDYTYTVTGIAPCPSGSAVITVTILSNADAGLDGAGTLCGSDDPVELYSELGGTPDAGGTWFAPNGSITTDTFDPSTQAAGTYTYILYVPAPCTNDTATVIMAIIAPADAGTDGSATLCSDDPPLVLFGVLGGTPDVGGTWNGPNGIQEGVFDPGSDTPGGYVYTVQATAPCPNVSVTVDVAVNTLPDAGTNGSITLCPESAPIQLFSLLGGTPMSGGTWTGPGGVPSNGTFDPASSPQGVYTYTVFGVAPCPNASASSTATVFLIAPPNAGPDAVSCTLSFTLNATGNWASGTWNGPAGIVFADPTAANSGVTATAGGSYTFTWSVLSNDGCATQDQVTITFTDAIVPAVAVTDAICNGACDGTASVNATGGNTVGGLYTYQWSNALAGNVPNASGICAGSYTVTVLDMNNCNTVAPFTIGEPDLLVIDAIVATDETCPGSCDGIIIINDPLGAQYSINSGASFTSSAVFTGLCPGDFNIVMQDANGCVAAGSAEVGTPAPVVAGFNFTPETLLVTNPLAQFTNTSSPNGIHFSWDFGGLGSSTAEDPAFTFPGGLGNSYMVCLTVTDANDCPDEYCAPVQVFDVLMVHVPNVFTPNEDDVNEGFCPIFNLEWAVESYDFMIFNRWGEKLFESMTVHEKWDGLYRSEIVQEDVYVWKMKCRDKLTNEWIERIGHVTVLK